MITRLLFWLRARSQFHASGFVPRRNLEPGAGNAKRWSNTALALHLALALVACAPAASRTPAGPAGAAATPVPASFPITVTDDAGRQVTVPAEPRRIVSTAPSNTEILFALGLGDRVVAVTNFCDYPEEAKQKPKIGGLRPNLETIIAHQPDFVLAVRGTPLETVAALEAQRIPVAILNPPDFAGVLANIRAVGRLTGASTAADRLAADMQQRWNAIAEKARTATSRPRVFFEIDATDPAAVSAAGPGTFIDAMITAAGGVNVLATLTPGQQYPRVSAEALLQANPDLILLGTAPFGQTPEVVARRPGWSAIEAVQRGRIVGIYDPNVTSRPGPRLVEGLDLIARAIHPELFGPLPPPPSR